MLKTVSSITNAIGALNYKGTWDANANVPPLASGVGTKGDYYVVGTAGTTTLDGISNWGIGDWAVFNGSVWQRVEGGADLNGVNLSVTGTSTLSALTASTALALNASKQVVSVTNTGTGSNVLATAPTLVGNVSLSTGDFLIAKTTNNDTSENGLRLLNGGSMTSTMQASTNADFGYVLYSKGASAYRFYVGLAGTIFATSTTISAISDIRFKENVRDLDAGLAEVMSLKPRLYDWKEGKGASIKNARGFIAQEFEQVFPDLIDEWRDPAPEGEEPYKSVRQDLIPVLVKAMQEQQAIIQALTARVAALESAKEAL